MKLGFYTYSYVDRLKREVEPVLRAVAEAGYDGIDLSATWHDDLDPAAMPAGARRRYADAAGRLGLEIEAVVTHLGLAQALHAGQPINLPGAVDVARDVGAKVVTVHSGFPGAGPAAPWPASVDYLRRACDYAGRHGVVIALDGVWAGTPVDTPDKALRLAAEVGSPHFRHNYDPCYLEVSGHRIEEATPLLLPHVVHVHCKDYTGRPGDFRHRIPGEGVLDARRYLRLLHEAGYGGYVVNECFTDAPLERACEVGYRTLAGALRELGARPAKASVKNP